MSNPFLSLQNEKKVLIAAHRGSCGGNIPCNSLPAFQIALNYGADIIELDVERAADGKFYIQHPGMEPVHLRMKDSITKYPSDVVSQMVLSNCDLNRTQYPIVRLEEALDYLKGKCIINLDKFYMNPEGIAKVVRERGMEDQVLLKINMKDASIDAVEQFAPDMPVMPMVWTEDDCLERFAHRNIRYVGSECLFRNESDPIASEEYIEKMHKAGKTLWANTIVYNYQTVLSAGHTDDISVMGDPDNGWGWLADRGFDIIQTDWVYHCYRYLKDTGRKN
ncbi:MAG: glycerophosphodiester phosphodiesterase family protein [Clostridia bacterium]|nr:glycerophosphodiester phosphodiesterase family protein [Clostridia bacterium]